MRSRVAGLILSAGASTRMGKHKALLKIGDKTLLKDQVNRLRLAGIDDIYIVVGCGSTEIIDAHPKLEVEWIVNNDWELGKFSSVVTGTKAVPFDIDGLLVLLVDVVGVEPKIISTIIKEGIDTGQNIMPVYQNHGGHPVFIQRSTIETIQKSSPTKGRLDFILRDNPNTTRFPVNSPNILNNINTPEEMRIYTQSCV